MDTARDSAGGLLVIEHANRQSCCLQLDSGRSLDQIIRDFVILEFTTQFERCVQHMLLCLLCHLYHANVIGMFHCRFDVNYIWWYTY